MTLVALDLLRTLLSFSTAPYPFLQEMLLEGCLTMKILFLVIYELFPWGINPLKRNFFEAKIKLELYDFLVVDHQFHIQGLWGGVTCNV